MFFDNTGTLNMIIKKHFRFSFVFLIIFCHLCWAREIVVGFGYDRTPYVIEKNNTGLEIDIFREALAIKGHTLAPQYMSNARLQVAMENPNSLEAIAAVRSTPGDGLYYVNDFVCFDNYAISRAKDNLKINEISDLKGLTIIAWQNAYRDLGPLYASLFKPLPNDEYKALYKEIVNQESQSEMFWRGRAQVIIVDKLIFNWYRKNLIGVDTTELVKLHTIFPQKTYCQTAFRNKALAIEFEDGLNQLKKSGRYNELRKKYEDF
jgi:polar amino acid transport system substrate-binding protein